MPNLSVHGGADEQLAVVLQEDGAHVEDDPAVVLPLRGRPEQSPPLLPRPGQVPHHHLTTGIAQTHTVTHTHKLSTFMVNSIADE